MPVPPPRAPLAGLPLGMLLRNLIISTATASPLLLPPSLALLSRVANPKGALLNLDKNPVLRLAVKKVLYQQFCAGENGVEVARACDKLKKLGFNGVILCYGKEAVLAKGDSGIGDTAAETRAVKEIEAWRAGNLETVGLAKAGDYVALK
jgi:proline dehydrogenase